MLPQKSLPTDVTILVDIKFIDGEGELLEQGIVTLGESAETKDFRLAGLAAQRGAYEMLLKLWLKWEKDYSS